MLKIRTPTAIRAFLCALNLFSLASCHSQTNENVKQPVTITFIGWGPATLQELAADRTVLEDFTRKTGIQVKFIVGPESMTDRLQVYMDALERKSSTPDVLYTDVVWPGVLADYLIDLKPYASAEARLILPEALKSDTVDGRLVAIPFNMEAGLMYYRSDLLSKYGFSKPPETWDELERMAGKIQAGERARGRKDFWGYVWQGALYEGLTCDALEWQASLGGGRIIEDDGTISVNNPEAVRALKMAKSWIGSISPPSVLAFKEADAQNIWDSGNAAFRRDWVWRGNPPSKQQGSFEPGSFGITLPPGGRAGHASLVGGQSLAVSKYSVHPREAAELVRYLTSRDVQMWLWDKGSMIPVLTEFYRDPQYLASRPQLERLKGVFTGGTIARPSAVSGKHYPEISKAYYTSVHLVLTGEATAEKAMADLEAQLVQITGFKTGMPNQNPGASGKTN